MTSERAGRANWDGDRGDGSPPSKAVIEVIAEAENEDPTSVPVLHDVLDPEALDTLFRGREPGCVEFTYAGYQVTVNADGRIVVREPGSE